MFLQELIFPRLDTSVKTTMAAKSWSNISEEQWKKMSKEEKAEGYMIIVNALKIRKAKLEEETCQAEAKIQKMQKDLSEVQERNHTLGYCNCNSLKENSASQNDFTNCEEERVVSDAELTSIVSSGPGQRFIPSAQQQTLERYFMVQNVFTLQNI